MTAEAPSKGDILIVDDQIENLRTLESILTAEGYYIRPAINGALALKAARKQAPDLVLLDIMMPGMDGYRVCENLKADSLTRDVPVIFISALSETQNKVRGFQVGGVDYITKPFQVNEVLARVKTHVALRQINRKLQETNQKLLAEIEEHTVAKQKISRHEAELQSLFDHMLDGFAYNKIITNDDGKVIDFIFLEINRAFEKLTGLGQEDLIGQRATQAIPQLAEQEFDWIGTYGQVALTGQPIQFEQYFPPHNCWYYVSAYSPKPNHFAFTFEDISERHEQEMQLRLQATALNAAANAIVITDIKGKILWVNPAFTKLTGYSTSEVLGKNPSILKSGQHSEDFYANLWNTVLSGEVWQGELINRRKNGNFYNEVQTITPVYNQRGQITHFIAIKERVRSV